MLKLWVPELACIEAAIGEANLEVCQTSKACGTYFVTNNACVSSTAFSTASSILCMSSVMSEAFVFSFPAPSLGDLGDLGDPVRDAISSN